MNIIETIRLKLKEPLPNKLAWKEMSGRLGDDFSPTHNHYKKASVLICLLHSEDSHKDFLIPFIERTEDNGPHSKQISFPGGKFDDKHDANLLETALREAKEEIAIPSHDIQILGELSPLYIPVSNFMVYPFVGFLDYHPELKPDPIEVDNILFFNLSDFLNEKNKRKQWIKIKTQNLTFSLNVPAFVIDEKIIWGATAMILNEFLYVYKEVLKNL